MADNKNFDIKSSIPLIITAAGTILFLVTLMYIFTHMSNYEFVKWAKSHLSITGEQSFSNYAWFALVSTILITCGVPRLWISSLAGAVFGLTKGIPLALTASLGGALIVFIMGKYGFHLLLEKLSLKRLEKFKNNFVSNTFFWVLYIRLFPFSNNTITSFFCGSMNVAVLPYLTASFLGFIPLTIIFALFGSGSVSMNFWKIAVGFLLIGITIFIQLIVQKRMKHEPDKIA